MRSGSAKYVGAVLLAASIVGFAALAPVDVLTVRLPRRAFEPILAVHIAVGDKFIFAYRHSVELTPVEGHFRIGPGPTLLIEDTRFTSVGTGLPNSAAGRTRREDGWFIVEEGQRMLDCLRFFVAPVNRSRLVIAEKTYPLDSLVPGSLVAIAVERLRAYQWLRLQYATSVDVSNNGGAR